MIKRTNSAEILKKIYLICIGIILCSFALKEIHDYDIFLHLKTGQWILENHKIPTTQLYSYVLGDKRWLDHEWLFQILLYFIYKLRGFDSLIIFRFSVIFSIFLVFYRISRKNQYFFLSVLSIFSVLELLRLRLQERPDIITLLFVVLFYYLIKEGFRKKGIFLLIPLQILWANIHGYFILGPLLLFLYILSELIKRKANLPFNWNERRIEYKYLKKLVMLLLVLLLCCLANPYFLNGFMYPLKIIFSSIFKKNIYAFNFIAELMSLKIGDIISGQNFYIFLLLSVFFISLLINIRKLDIYDLIIFCVFLIMLLIAIRHISLFVVLTGMMSLFNLRQYNGIAFDKFNKFKAYIKPVIFKTISAVILFLILLSISKESYAFLRSSYVYSLRGDSKYFVFGISEMLYPDKAAAFIEKTGKPVNILHPFNCGSYLVWKLYPKYKVFIDGRTEVYGDDFLRKHKDLLSDYKKIDVFVDRFNVGYMILYFPYGSIYRDEFKFFYKNRNWVLVFLDNKSAVFVKNIPAFKEIIRKNRIDLNTFKIVSEKGLIESAAKKKAYPASFINMARFFYIIGMPDKMLEMVKIAERIYPDDYEIYNLKGVALSTLGKHHEGLIEFFKAAKLNPNAAEVHKNIGVAFTKLGRLEDALKVFEYALKINPQYDEVKEDIKKVKELMKDKS